MGTVAAALRKYTALRNALPAIIRQTLEENKEGIEELNREQLKKGETSEGGRFKRYRSSKYAQKKAALNSMPGFGNPDLELGGGYASGIQITISQNIIHTFSTDYKASFLEQTYNADLIYGLNEKNRKAFIQDTLRSAFINNIKAFLNSKI